MNTAFPAARRRASAKEIPSRRMRSRIRCSERKAECPSFMCQTEGWKPRVRRAATPPIPSTSS